MTTARDVIAKAICCWYPEGCVREDDCLSLDREAKRADAVISALLSAPEPVRLELAALLSPGRSMSPGRSINPWRPIETAPKDGNEILLGCFREAKPIIQFVAFWDDEARHDTHRWQTADGIAYHNDLPTHWRPLPAPPSEDKT